jgi:hypothetical protein
VEKKGTAMDSENVDGKLGQGSSSINTVKMNFIRMSTLISVGGK